MVKAMPFCQAISIGNLIGNVTSKVYNHEAVNNLQCLVQCFL